jgi:protocatechuate 3,4-dioxygenase, alpha subunit
MTTPTRLVASPSQTVGPFFHVGPGGTDRLGQMAGPNEPGEHIRLRIRVLDGDGQPVSDALIELLQTNAAGHYSSPSATPGTAAFAGFGRLGTDDMGSCTFDTIKPGAVAASDDSQQAPHINVCFHARGLLRHLYTRVYFEGDAGLADDPVLALVPAARRDTLLARRTLDGRVWDFVIRLQGNGETVFFDV